MTLLFSSLSGLFDHHNYDYYWDIPLMSVAIHCTTALDFLIVCNFGSAIPHLPGCFCPWTFFWNMGLKTLPSDLFMSRFVFSIRIFYKSSRLCNWLSLQCLVPWINQSPRVCWSTFCLVLNHNRFAILLQWKTPVLLFSFSCKHIYFHMSWYIRTW